MRPSEGHVAGSIPAGRTNPSGHCGLHKGSHVFARCRLVLVLAACAAAAQAQTEAADAAPARTPAALSLPAPADIQLTVPRPVRAATAALGLGRQRLALVVGIGSVGQRRVVDPAPRDAQAVAAALHRAGFVVMRRDDVTAAELRAALHEFRTRLQPEGMGFVYATALGAQVDGHSVLLPSELGLDAARGDDGAGVAAALRVGAVPLAELVDALQGPAGTPRLLVVDAAYRHPALDKLPQPGLAAPRLPPGLIALFSHALASTQEVPAAAPLPIPEPDDPRRVAASPFAAALVTALATPRISGAEALRSARRALVASSDGRIEPWIGGDTDASEEFAEVALLDGLLPRTPEEIAREGVRQAVRVATRPDARAGDQAVLQQTAGSSAQANAGPAAESTARHPAPQPASSAGTTTPGATTPGAGLGGGTLGTVGSAAGTVAGVAAAAAGVVAAARAVEATVVAQAATTALAAVGSVASDAVAMAARAVAGDAPARQAVASATASHAARPNLATTPGAPASPPPAAGGPALALPQPLAPAPIAATPAAATPAAAAQLPRPLPGVIPATPVAAAAAAAGELPVQQIIRAAALAAAARPAPQPPAQAPGPATPAPSATDADGRATRRHDAGERPMRAPRVNSFGYVEGDTFTYRTIDTWKGEVSGEYTHDLEEVLGDGAILANGQQVRLDPEGRLVQLAGEDGSFTRFEPSQAWWWSRPQRGQRRDIEFIERFGSHGQVRGEVEWKGSASVGRVHKVETPAGTFDALPIESSGWWYRRATAGGATDSGQWSRTVWYSPALGHPVAIDVEESDRLGKLLKRERTELLRARTQRSAAP